jgi:two-component system KDP operon response regulator KdpE
VKAAGPPPPLVLMIEDERQIRRFVRAALEAEGCHVVEAESAENGLIEAGTRKPDLLIVDLGLPGRDGLELIEDLRRWSPVPVLVLSARSGERDKVAALDAGADDYLTKPFGVAELLARVRALLRRARPVEAGSGTVVGFGDVEIDLARRVVTRAGAAVHLTPIEYKLLGHLVANAGRVLTRETLIARVWGPHYVGDTKTLDVHIKRLRSKVEEHPATPVRIVTIRGLGYKYEVPARSPAPAPSTA